MREKVIRAVLGLAVNQNGEFLVTRRVDPDRKEFDGKWQIPGGGVEKSESNLDTLNREMWEELGVKVKLKSLFPIEETQIREYENIRLMINLTTFLVELEENSNIKLNEESTEFRWVTLQTLDLENSLPATPIILKKAEELLKSL